MITGVMAANSVNILGAQINTMTNGIALDVLQVKNAIGELITDEGKIRRIEAGLADVITGKIRVNKLVEKMKPSILDRKIKPKVPTRIAIDNEVSETFTVIDIHTEDRIGLLYRISSTLSSLGLYIHVAKISTKGRGGGHILRKGHLRAEDNLEGETREDRRNPPASHRVSDGQGAKRKRPGQNPPDPL